jgi:hypothetical protein
MVADAMKEGNLLLHAHPGHTAIRVPSFRMFDHLFMDARASKQFRALQTDFINP